MSRAAPAPVGPGPSEVDAVVVGAGPNGLAAAVALAREGWRVVVFEGESTIGGGARTEELTLPGFLHDTCSAVHPLAAGSPFFRTLPLADHGLAWVHPGAPLAHPLEDGSAAVLERSLEATARGLGADGGAWESAVGPLARSWERVADEALAPLHWPRHPLAAARLAFRAPYSAAALARARFRTEPARALVGGLGAHGILPLDRLPTGVLGLLLAAAGHAVGWPFPRGGAAAIPRALASLLASLGGEVQTGRRIASLTDLPAARAVLLDVTPWQFLTIAGPWLPSRYRLALARYRYGPAAFKVDWALEGPIPWRSESCARAGTVHVGGTLDEMAASERVVAEGEVSARPFTLVAQPSGFDPTRAPAGGHVAWAYCHVPNGWRGDATQAIERQIERFAPGFGRRILARSVRGPRELEAANPNCVGGDIAGGALDLGQLVARPVSAPSPYRTPLNGVFLCSSSTPPGAGVHGMCGFYAARATRRQGQSRGPAAGKI